MKELQLFKNPKFGDIRVVEIDGKPHFVAIDVARGLGYKNPNDAITRHCKGYVKHAVLDNNRVTQNMNIIPQGDVYRLAAKSELPGAEEFESWIFDVVIPSIVEHGAYMTPQTIDNMIADPEFGIKLLTALKDEQEKRSLLEKKAAIMQPKADFVDKAVDIGHLSDIGQASKLLKLPYGRNTFFKKLREMGILFKNRNEPKQEYIDRGYFELRIKNIPRDNHPAFLVTKVLVTAKGLLWLSEKLNRGYSANCFPQLDIQ